MKNLLILLLTLSLFSGSVYASMTDITTGLVAHYEFENNTSDSSSSEFNLTANTTENFVSGIKGQAFDFSGNYLYTSATTGLSDSNGTISYWMKSSNTSQSMVIIGDGSNVDTNITTISASIYANDGNLSDSTAMLTLHDDTWHHVAITFNDLNVTKIYYDGVEETLTTDNNVNLSLGDYIYLGDYSAGVINPYAGLMDEVRIYSRELTATDITALYDDVIDQPKLLLKAHGGVMQFDGNSSTVTTSTVTTQTNNITLEAWINWDGRDLGEGQTIIYQGDQSNSGYGLKLNPISSTYRYAIVAGGVASLYTTEVVTTGWHHMVATFDGNWKLYVDGVDKTLNSTTGTPNTPTDYLKIGSDISHTAAFTGLIDEVRIWNIARTQTDIQDSMNHQLDGNETGLTAYYNFDERVGDKVVDITANANDATADSNVSRLNFLGDTLHLSGTSSFIWDGTTTNTTVDSLSELTVHAWINLDATTGSDQYIIQKDGVLDLKFSNSTNKIIARIGDGTTFGDECNSTTAISYSQWYSIAASYSDSKDEMNIYINGNLDSTCTGITTVMGGNTSNNLKIGSNSTGTENLQGYISQFSIWNTELNEEETKEYENITVSGTENGLKAYWSLNEGLGTTAFDTQGVNDWTISGSSWSDTAPKIYGDKIYTSDNIYTVQKLVVENNTTTSTYSYNGGVPSTISDFNTNALGVFKYKSTNDTNETLDINATDGATQLNTIFEVINYDNPVYLTLEFTNVNLLDFNITNVQIYGVDGNSESLNIPEIFDGNISDGNSSYTVPIFYPDNNFTIEVNATKDGSIASSSWYYNFTDKKLYPDANTTTDFKTNIGFTNSDFTIDTSLANREYYNFTGNITNNDNNVSYIVLSSQTEGIGYGDDVNETDTSYSINFSELDDHEVLVSVNGTLWYYNITTGDINVSSSNSIIDTSTGIRNFDLNLSTLNFESNTSTNSAPYISAIYDQVQRPGYSAYSISFDINDTEGDDINISVTSLNSIVTLSSAANVVGGNTVVTLAVATSSIESVDYINVSVTDTYNVNTRGFGFVVSNHYDTISQEEAVGSVSSFTGTLYMVESYYDYNSTKEVEIEKFDILNSSHAGYTEIEDHNGTVTISTEVETMPATFQYDVATIDYSTLSSMYSTEGMPFTFSDINSTGRKVYVTFTSDYLDPYHTAHGPSGTYSNIDDFMADHVEGKSSYGVMRNKVQDKLLLFDVAELNTTSGSLIEVNALTAAPTGQYGSWMKTTVNSTEVLAFDTSSLTGYYGDEAYMLDGGEVKAGDYVPNGTIFSFVMLNKEAKEEMYKSISPNPKIKISLTSGYNYVSLQSDLSLCTSAYQTYTSICDQNMTIEDIFTSNSDIDRMFKYEDAWQYRESNTSLNPTYGLNRFSIVSPLDGLVVHTTAATTMLLPFNDDSEQINDYSGMFVDSWYLLSNNKTQTVSEISTSVSSQSKAIMYIMIQRDNVWNIYAPTNDSSIDSTIPRLSTVKKGEVFWIILKAI